tara:strand:+ start:255 stop:914 length:660 start_codon:yes stop_codon:yes gene_type:complete
MSEEIKVKVQEDTIVGEPKTEQTDIKSLVDAEVSKAIKNIKSNLDNAYTERDNALAAVAEAKSQKQKSEIESLEKQGKHSEVMQMKIAEMSAKLETYEQKNTELSRDNAVRSQLNSLNFKSDKAATMAYQDIVGSLKKDSTGNWVHENGLSINDAVSSYAKDDNNAFLFSVKANAGTGINPAKPASGNNPVKSIKEMSTDELILNIEKGNVKVDGDWAD